MLAWMIRMNQQHIALNHAIRWGARAYQFLTPWQARTACPYAGRCSQTSYEDALALGWKAAPALLARIARCSVYGDTTRPT